MKKLGIMWGSLIIVLAVFSYCFAKMPPSYFNRLKQRAREKCITSEKRGILKEITHHHLYLFGKDGMLLRFNIVSSVKVVFPGGAKDEKSSRMLKNRSNYLKELGVPIPSGTLVKVLVCEPEKKVVKIIIEELPQ